VINLWWNTREIFEHMVDGVPALDSDQSLKNRSDAGIMQTPREIPAPCRSSLGCETQQRAAGEVLAHAAVFLAALWRIAEGVG
jgi:hypothetical protein